MGLPSDERSFPVPRSKATFFGNANEQVHLAASQISDLPFLSRGFDAIGFSQGGQLLRAYVERYNRPPVRNLITLGSCHCRKVTE